MAHFFSSRPKTNVFKIYAGAYFRAKYFPQKLIPRENFNNNKLLNY